MKNFEVHELVDGWTGQCATLEDALHLRDDIIANSEKYGQTICIKITAEVDESDL